MGQSPKNQTPRYAPHRDDMLDASAWAAAVLAGHIDVSLLRKIISPRGPQPIYAPLRDIHETCNARD